MAALLYNDKTDGMASKDLHAVAANHRPHCIDRDYYTISLRIGLPVARPRAAAPRIQLRLHEAAQALLPGVRRDALRRQH